MTDKRYWLWLQMALGEGARFKEIIDDFGSVEKLYDSNILEWRMSSCLTAKQINSLQRYTLEDTQQIIYNCENNNWQIICYDDDKYPDRLRQIPNPPAALYVDGELPDIDSLAAIGMVGTRKASKYAIKTAKIIGYSIADCNGLVISGGALGVDTASHKGALMAKGKTIAVLGCGLGTSYLNENKGLRQTIKQNGALVTEYSPFTSASRTTFPLRNRIISGLSLGVLVVEAGVKSGSLITAKYANEQNRDVFAIPSSLLDVNFAGSNKLISDGATVVTGTDTIISAYSERYNSLNADNLKSIEQIIAIMRDNSANAPKSSQELTFDNIVEGRRDRLQKEDEAIKLSGNEKLIYGVLDDRFNHIDNIIENSGLSSSEVLTALTMLEMKGIVESTSGKRYKKA